MNTFQAVVFSVIHGLAEFLPISSSAHDRLLPFFLGLPEPTPAFLGTLSLGSLLSLLIYFRHDWASITSCFLQVIIFRKKPMTLDERFPLFLSLTTLPAGVAWYYLRERLAGDWSPLVIAALLAGAAIPLVFTESMSRKTKGMFDWNWLDCLSIGATQVAGLLPGVGRTAAAFPGAFIRNYNREAAAKYIFLAGLPFLAGSAFFHLHAGQLKAAVSAGEMSWLTFAVTVVVTMFTGLLAIGGFMKHIQRKAFGQYVGYRLIVAAAVVIKVWTTG